MSADAGRILAALPQTQCTRCAYPDCAAYAEAIAHGEARINRCPPGGAEGIARLSAITGQAALPLDAGCGVEGPRSLAWIDEDWCIGCTLCIDACPTDAIVGSHKQMHTVIERYCTGCELCVPVCPVDCIALENASGASTGWDAWSQPQAALARARHAQRSVRRLAAQGNTSDPLRADMPAAHCDASIGDKTDAGGGKGDKRAVIAAALARARSRQSQS